MKNVIVDSYLNGKILEHTYFIHEENIKECICVDPGYDASGLINYIDKNEFKVNTILLTHGHFDHMLGCHDLYDRFGTKIFISEEDAKLLYSAEHNYSNLINKTTFDKFPIYKYVKNAEVLDILNFKIKCISTPGHTKGSFSYFFENEKLLFSGDTLFYETFGRTDLFGGSYEDVKNSLLNNLFLLPDDTKVYPGHGGITTIGYEKIHNVLRRRDNEF